MSKTQVKVLVCDDDFRVAHLHAALANEVAGIEVVATVNTLHAARDVVQQHHIDVVLLDRFLPDGDGLKFAAAVQCDVFMVTAENSALAVAAALRAGVMHYLVKPFDGELLRARLAAYVQFQAALVARETCTQAEIDAMLGALYAGVPRGGPMQAEDSPTQRLVLAALREAEEPLSAAGVAALAEIGRATAQRYLATLAKEGVVRVELNYGSAGRPEHRYRVLG